MDLYKIFNILLIFSYFSPKSKPLNRKTTDRNQPVKPSIIFTLFQMFKYQFWSSFGVRLLTDLLGFANPLLLHRLLAFVSAGSGRLWEGILYAILMFIASELKSLGHNHVQVSFIHFFQLLPCLSLF